MTQRVYNFSAGPAVMPLSVLEQARDEMLSLPGVGMSVMEMSHRSPEFQAIHDLAISNLRTLLSVPENFKILLLQGGSRLQFSMIPMNLLRGQAGPASYLISGTWGKKALAEARREGAVDVVWDGQETNFDRLPTDRIEFAENSAYLHYTANETIQGVQFSAEPDCGSVPLVCDASSEFLSRPIDFTKQAFVYACAQKNAGPAGVTVLIIRDDLLERSSSDLPGYLNYQEHEKAGSMFNTPPTFAIYILKLVTEWLMNEIGGIDKIQAQNESKAAMLYTVIDASDGFYRGHAQPDCRSRMNVTFNLPNEDLQAQFIADAAKNDLRTLKGHRSVGGIRASIYNAMPVAGVTALRDFMTDFRSKHA